MDLRRLNYFLAVVENGSVSRAAAALHIAQPALSRQVHALERDLDLTLFTPHRGRLVLTPAGQAFAAMAKDLSHRAERLASATEALRFGSTARITIAATPTTTKDLLAPFVATLRPPQPLVLTRPAHHFELPALLRADADMIVSPVPVDDRYATRRLHAIPVVAYVALDHPLARAGATTIALADLVRERVITSSRSAVSRTVLDLATSTAGLTYADVHVCDDGATVQALASAGQGVGILTERPDFGAHRLDVTDSHGARIDTLHVSLQLAWDPEHYAVDTITELASGIQAFQASMTGADVEAGRDVESFVPEDDRDEGGQDTSARAGSAGRSTSGRR